MWHVAKAFIVLGLFLNAGEADPIKNDVSYSQDVSKKCYYCMGEAQNVDNIAACSIDNEFDIEECSLEDRFDKCVVVQAFSLSKNTTIFKRECTSRRFCEEMKICSDPDYLDCRYECCTGDLCNDFDFSNDVGVKEPQPTIAMTTRKSQELVQSERSDTQAVTRNLEQSTVKPEVVVTESGQDSAGIHAITKQSLSTTETENPEPAEQPATSSQVKHDRKEGILDEDCEDLDNDCPSYVTESPSFCKDNDYYTSIACKKTCKFCKSDDAATTKKPAPRPTKMITTSISKTPYVEDCQDKRKDCKELTKMDNCRQMASFMKENCEKSCGYCSTKASTAKTQLVTGKITTSQPVVTEPSTMRLSTASPVNTELLTKSMTEQTASQHTEQIVTTASPTTDNVQSGITKQSEECQDKRENCAFLKLMNYCTVMPWLMKTDCRKTCAFCTNGKPLTPKLLPKTTSKPMLHSPTSHVTSDQLIEPSPEPTYTMTPSTSASTSQPTTSQSTTLQPTTSQPTTSQPTTSQPTTSQPTTSQPTTSQPTTSKPATRSTASKMKTPSTIMPTTPNGDIPFGPSKDCVDKTILCEEFSVMSGYCVKEKDFMSRNCPKSCGFCKSDETKPSEITTPGIAMEHTTEPQVTTSVELKQTTSKVPAAPEVTPKITKEVTSTAVSEQTTAEPNAEPSPEPNYYMSTVEPSAEKPTTKSIIINKDCYDRRTKCEQFAKYPGYCKYSKDFMTKYCPKSCGFCTNGGSSGPVASISAVVTTEAIVKTTAEATPKVTTKSLEVTAKPTPKITTDEATTAETPTYKENEMYDIVFVIGARNPNASESFQQQTKIIKEIWRKSTLPDSRYGLVVYSHKTQVNFRLNAAIPVVILNELLDVLRWQAEGTRVDKGILKALEQFGRRPEANKRIVAFINGKTDATNTELAMARQEVESGGVQLIVVGQERGYDPVDSVILAPDPKNRVLVTGTASDDVTKAASDTIEAIIQDQTDFQGGLPGDIPQILGPKNPETAKFGNNLRWRIWPWGECVTGKQFRTVRCYHLFDGKDYHVAINACIQHVAEMPEKQRSC